MSEVKDPKIKLFGKTIELPETSATAEVSEEEAAGIGEAAQCCDAAGEDSLSQDPPCSSNSNILEDSDFNGDAEDQDSLKSQSCPNREGTKAEEKKDQPLTSSEESKDSDPSPPLVDDSKTEEDQSETDNAHEKTLKKPDKILPCPRCNSMDTKFCYFNNYNVNQPRHFCKNCQRYWTAGGTMRNVPVGAGRRKNKNTAPQVRHLNDPPNGAHQPNGILLTFNSDPSLCESMVSALNIADKDGPRNRAHNPVSNADDPGTETGRPGLPDPGPNYHPLPWSYPFPYAPAHFPPPFYSTPPPYWRPMAIHGSWNVPCFYPPDQGPTSPTLGKHSRDETVPKPANQEEGKRNVGNLWVPKTLRIGDPGNDAAKSSIWATLGIKNESSDSIGGGGLVRALQRRSKGEERMKDRENSTILQANPAALSRSIQFHESM